MEAAKAAILGCSGQPADGANGTAGAASLERPVMCAQAHLCLSGEASLAVLLAEAGCKELLHVLRTCTLPLFCVDNFQSKCCNVAAGTNL